jgi:hypothetical protein
LVVQATDERTRCNASGPLNRSGYRCILVQGTRPRLIVQLDNITPTGPRNGKFFIPGIRGLAKWCSFMEG